MEGGQAAKAATILVAFDRKAEIYPSRQPYEGSTLFRSKIYYTLVSPFANHNTYLVFRGTRKASC